MTLLRDLFIPQLGGAGVDWVLELPVYGRWPASQDSAARLTQVSTSCLI
jgi:hypothetical protein